MPNRAGHRRFGNVRKRESGRFQIRYPGRMAVCVPVLRHMSVRATPRER